MSARQVQSLHRDIGVLKWRGQMRQLLDHDFGQEPAWGCVGDQIIPLTLSASSLNQPTGIALSLESAAPPSELIPPLSAPAADSVADHRRGDSFTIRIENPTPPPREIKIPIHKNCQR